MNNNILRIFISTLFLFIFTNSQAQIRLPKELNGKWEGEVFVNSNNATLEGVVSIILGAFLSESKDQIEFYIHDFGSSKRKMFRYIQTELKNNEMGFAFRYELPSDENESFVEGSYDFTLMEIEDTNYLLGNFSDEKGDVTAIFILFKKKDYKRLRDSGEYKDLLSRILLQIK